MATELARRILLAILTQLSHESSGLPGFFLKGDGDDGDDGDEDEEDHFSSLIGLKF